MLAKPISLLSAECLKARLPFEWWYTSKECLHLPHPHKLSLNTYLLSCALDKKQSKKQDCNHLWETNLARLNFSYMFLRQKLLKGAIQRI